jgi:hypothetical protein
LLSLFSVSSAKSFTRSEKGIVGGQASITVSDGAMISQSEEGLEMQLKYKQTLEENVQLKAIMRKEALVRLERAKKEAAEAMEVTKAKINQGAPEVAGEGLTEACTTDKAWKLSNFAVWPIKKPAAGQEAWAGRCKTLDECKTSCEDAEHCTAFNWWPRKGGCRLYGVSLDNLEGLDACTTGGQRDCVKTTQNPTIGGSPSCECSGEHCNGPYDTDTCPDADAADLLDEADM